VADPDAALNAAGLAFTPDNGSFQVLVRNRQTGITTTHDVIVDLNGVGDDMTLADLAAALGAIDGISAAVTPRGELTVAADSADLEFAFAGDTSGVLAALGVNTFFTGSTARTLGVNAVLRSDPGKLAASRGGIGADTAVAVELAGLLDRPLNSQDGTSLAVMYDRMMGEAAQASTVTRSVAEGTRVFEETLRGQKLATSGVSLDEEAVKLIGYQRSFQASARFIRVLDELLGILVNL
jgi:flagellar hook-associated protein 1 FlgK